jgi:hypothetical protein
LLYKQNVDNDLFELYYVYDFGTQTDPKLALAVDYFSLLGTGEKSLQEIQREFYALGCSFRIQVLANRTYVIIDGLNENMERAVALAETYMQQVQDDESVLAQLKANTLKERDDAKHNQRANYSALQRYTFYGPQAVQAQTLTNEQLVAQSSESWLESVRALKGYTHTLLYYGPDTQAQVANKLNEMHHVSSTLSEVKPQRFPLRTTVENEVLLAQYEAKQIYYLQYTNLNRPFAVENDANVMMYNTYFGGGMNAIVFQEMREARALAYSAFANLSDGRDKEDPYTFYAFIATQNDKMQQAIETFEQIIEQMPESEEAFEVAKQGVLSNLATQRTVRAGVLTSYLDARKRGVTCDRNKAIYEVVQRMTLADVVAFHDQWIKNRHYTFSILGDRNEVDMTYLRSLGPVRLVDQRELFGY